MSQELRIRRASTRRQHALFATLTGDDDTYSQTQYMYSVIALCAAMRQPLCVVEIFVVEFDFNKHVVNQSPRAI